MTTRFNRFNGTFRSTSPGGMLGLTLRWVSVLLAGAGAAAAFGGSIAPSVLARASEAAVLDVMVTFRSPSSRTGLSQGVADVVQEIGRSYEVEVVRIFRELPIARLRVPSESLEALLADPDVLGIAPVRRVKVLRREGRALINVPSVRALGFDGRGVGIAVLDTGVDYRHKELSPGGVDFFAKTVKLVDVVDDDGDPADAEGHGTSVAGIAAGSEGGVAPAATVVAVRVLDDDGEGESDVILAGIDAVLASVRSGNPFNIRVANLSFGGYDEHDWPPGIGSCDDVSSDFATAFRALSDEGVVVVVAAGNGGCTRGVAWPACISHALSVGAVFDDEVCTLPAPPPFDCFSHVVSFGTGQCMSSGCSQGSEKDRITCYSDSGEALDVWAPADCAKVPTRGGGYEDCFGGTSASAPYVAGVAALLVQAHPDRSAVDVRHALRETGRPRRDDRNAVTRNRVDAADALSLLPTLCEAPETPKGVSARPTYRCGTGVFTVDWRPVQGISRYLVEASQTDDFTVAEQFTFAAPPATVTPSDVSGATSFYFRVRAESDCGAVSPWSEAVKVVYQRDCPPPAFSWIVPSVAGNEPGLEGSRWCTDLTVLNLDPAPAAVTLRYLGRSTSAQASVELDPEHQKAWPEVLASLFGITGPEAGAIVVESDARLLVLARTVSVEAAAAGPRSYGALVAAVDASTALDESGIGVLGHLRSDGKFRTNIEVVNIGTAPATVDVTIRSADGTSLAGLVFEGVEPLRRSQRTRIVPAGHAFAWAEVRVRSGGARVIVVASVVDGSSNDPVSVPMVARAPATD